MLVLGIVVVVLIWRVNMKKTPMNEEKGKIVKIELHSISEDAGLRD